MKLNWLRLPTHGAMLWLESSKHHRVLGFLISPAAKTAVIYFADKMSFAVGLPLEWPNKRQLETGGQRFAAGPFAASFHVGFFSPFLFDGS